MFTMKLSGMKYRFYRCRELVVSNLLILRYGGAFTRKKSTVTGKSVSGDAI